VLPLSDRETVGAEMAARRGMSVTIPTIKSR